MKLAAGVLPPILPSTQRVGYGRTLRIVVIVIAARGRFCTARRDFFNKIKGLTAPPLAKSMT
jgi:hypothetical protein